MKVGTVTVKNSMGIYHKTKTRVEREMGGGIGMGNTCKPMAVSFQCMKKFTTNK